MLPLEYRLQDCHYSSGYSTDDVISEVQNRASPEHLEMLVCYGGVVTLVLTRLVTHAVLGYHQRVSSVGIMYVCCNELWCHNVCCYKVLLYRDLWQLLGLLL